MAWNRNRSLITENMKSKVKGNVSLDYIYFIYLYIFFYIYDQTFQGIK